MLSIPRLAALVRGLHRDGTRYVCIYKDATTALGRRRNGTIIEANPQRQLRRVRSRVAAYRLRLKRAKQTGSGGDIRQAQALYDQWSRILQDMRNCLRSEAATRAPNPDSACAAFGPSVRAVYPRIINGSACSSSSAAVELVLLDGSRARLAACSGTAVAPNAVVTAAHCFARQEIGTAVAAVQINTGGQSMLSGRFHVHPNFNINGANVEVNDIAVVILTGNLLVSFIPPLTANDLSAGEQAAIAGYVITENGGQQGLRAGFMSLGSVSRDSIIATYAGTGSDTCLGDSGGPLAVKRGTGWMLAGVTSNGDNESCGMDGKPDVASFANVSSPSNLAFLAQYVELR